MKRIVVLLLSILLLLGCTEYSAAPVAAAPETEQPTPPQSDAVTDVVAAVAETPVPVTQVPLPTLPPTPSPTPTPEPTPTP